MCPRYAAELLIQFVRTTPKLSWIVHPSLMYPQSRRTAHSLAIRKQDQMNVPLILVPAQLPATPAATHSLRHAHTRRTQSTPAQVLASCPQRKRPVHLLKPVWSPLQGQSVQLEIVSARMMVHTVDLHSLTLVNSRRTRSTNVRAAVSQAWSRTVERVPARLMLSRELLSSEQPPMTLASINAPAKKPMSL